MNELRKEEIGEKIQDIIDILDTNEDEEGKIACMLLTLHRAMLTGERHLAPMVDAVIECTKAFLEDLKDSFEPENGNIH